MFNRKKINPFVQSGKIISSVAANKNIFVIVSPKPFNRFDSPVKE
jgi:hypothetical protein